MNGTSKKISTSSRVNKAKLLERFILFIKSILSHPLQSSHIKTLKVDPVYNQFVIFLSNIMTGAVFLPTQTFKAISESVSTITTVLRRNKHLFVMLNDVRSKY